MKLPRPRFGLRTLLVVVLLCAVGLAFYTSPGRWRTYRNQQARQRIDPYELSIAGDGKPTNVPPELVAILGDSRLKHWRMIDQVEILPNETLISHGQDHVLSIWDLKTLRRKHSHDAKAFALSEDGKRAFVVRTDDQLEVWDPLTLQKLTTLQTLPANRFHYLAANGDGSRLAIESSIPRSGRELQVIDVGKNTAVWSYSTALSGSDPAILDPSGRLVAWMEDDSLHVTDVDSGKLLRTVGRRLDDEGRPNGVRDAVFSPDSATIIVAAGSRVIDVSLDSGDEVVIADLGGSTLDGLELSAKGDRLLVRLSNRVYEYRRGNDQWREQKEYMFAQGSVHDVDLRTSLLVATHNDGSLSFSNNYRPGTPWRLPNGGLGPDITSLAFDPRGAWLATGCRDGEMVIWSTVKWSIVRRWKAHASIIKYLIASRDGTQLISSSDDGCVVIWDSATGIEIAALGDFQMATPLSISANGERLATFTRGPSFAGFWDLPAATELPVSAIPWPRERNTFFGGGGILAPVFAPASAQVAARDRAGNVVFANSNTLQVTSQFLSTGQPLTPRAWFPDGRRIVILEEPQTLLIYDTQTKKTIHTLQLENQTVHSVAIDPSGKWLATCAHATPVQIWSTSTGKVVKLWQIGPQFGRVCQVEFSPDGHYLATVNGNGTAYVLSLDGVLGE